MVAQAKQLITLAAGVALTGTAIGPAVALFQTPQGPGGAGRDVLVEIDVPPGGAAVIAFQTHPGLVSKAVPASGDAGWVTAATFNATAPLQAIAPSGAFCRYNITTLGTGTLNMRVTGVQ